MTRCLTAEELEQLAFGPGAADSEQSAHVRGCAACRERLERERRDAALFAELRRAARPAGPPSVPGYRLEAELSRGGQGVVYRAVQEATNRAVALKVLAEGAAGSPRARRRFEREVELGSRLVHPGIVTIFDGGATGGWLWYAMELVEGETLDAYVARTRPELAERLRLFLELCEAVAHAHRHGVLHRDLKPANVLAGADGRVRVLDFGTALSMDAARRVTAGGEFLGTLAYASPEQVSAGSDACDTRSDVYSLGVVLYELVTGALPVEVEGGLAEAVERIARAAPVPLRARQNGIDRDLETIVLTALEKDRELRYPSVEALARDLRRFLAHEPIEARASGPGRVLALALRRHRSAALAAAIALAAGGALLLAFARARWQAERARADAALVRGVFEDVLAAAAPQRMGGDAPLRDVLALAAREIESSLRGAPDAQAAVQLTIGDTYRRLLRPAEAEPHLRAALERFRAIDGAGLEVARCLDALGLVLSAQNGPEAVAVQEEALALRRALLGEDDPLVAASERGLALAVMSRLREPDVARARELLESALARFSRSLGPEHVEVAETELALARLRRREGEPAGRLLEHAVLVFERPENARDPRRSECLTEYSSYLEVAGRLDEAEAVLERAQALTRELYGDVLAVDMLRRSANLRYARGELREAEDLTRRALVAELRGWSARRAEDAAEIEGVAARLEAAQPPASEPPYPEAFRLLRRFEGDGAFELAGWMNGIAVVMLPQGRLAPCKPLLREALEIRCRAWGADCPIRQRTLHLLGKLLHAQGRDGQAAESLSESIAIAQRRGEPDTADEARGLLAACCPATDGERP